MAIEFGLKITGIWDRVNVICDPTDARPSSATLRGVVMPTGVGQQRQLGSTVVWR
jgi:hypothetical protein